MSTEAETAPASAGNEHAFQAEISRLLELLSHSLYQNREIAVRELVSNASDALDKLRVARLSGGAPADGPELEIRLVPDDDAKTLEIRDTGVGMTREELVANLGTIAHSGSLDFLSKLSDEQKNDASIIGQFGVGFYSAFMLADRVEVVTRSAGGDETLCWASTGSGTYTIDVADEVLPRGTVIRLHLRENCGEFADETRVKYILKKYSTFVPHPIYVGDEHVNDQPPIWAEPKNSVTDEQYAKFYQYLSHHNGEDPLWTLHLAADSPIQFQTILYGPPSNAEKLGFGKAEHGLHLCAKRILVQNDCRELLPEYLRFIYGLVDSADLPLNVSRESLQDDSVFRKIKKVLTKRVLDHLGKLAKDDAATYATFVTEFGPVLREGISVDYENREKVAGLLRFKSTGDTDEALTGLDGYLDRAKDDQEQIYFLGGPSLAAIESSPHLEAFEARGLEVLLLDDPVDEFVLANLATYKEKKLVSADSADVAIPESATVEDKEEDAEPPQVDDAGMQKVFDLLKDALGDDVSEVRTSDVLAGSPARLVHPQGAMSAQMEKVLEMSSGGEGFSRSKKILELNPKHPLVARMSVLAGNEQNAGFIQDLGRQLHSNALLLTGTALDPRAIVERTEAFMKELAEKRSNIVF